MVEIRPLIERLKKFSSKIILFGSISRGESVKDSKNWGQSYNL